MNKKRKEKHIKSCFRIGCSVFCANVPLAFAFCAFFLIKKKLCCKFSQWKHTYIKKFSPLLLSVHNVRCLNYASVTAAAFFDHTILYSFLSIYEMKVKKEKMKKTISKHKICFTYTYLIYTRYDLNLIKKNKKKFLLLLLCFL